MTEHFTESELLRYIQGAQDDSDEITSHLENCEQCFRTYITLLELTYDARNPPNEDITDRIMSQASVRFHAWRWVAAGLLAVISVGIVGYFWPSSGEGRVILSGQVGSCTLDGSLISVGKPVAVGNLQSASFSVCDIRSDDDYLVRTLENGSVRKESSHQYRILKGVIAVDRRRNSPLVIEMGDVTALFQGTKAVFDVSSGRVAVLEGRVLLERREPHASWPVEAGWSSNLSGSLRPMQPEEVSKLRGLFRPLPSTGATFQRAMRDLHPGRDLIFQEVTLMSGKTVKGIVRSESEHHVVVTATGVKRIPNKDVKAIRFIPP